MEIITIPLAGALHHSDTMGNDGIIRNGEVQVMSAGTGLQHSEVNASETEQAQTLQLWIFPEIEGAAPRYDQKSFQIIKNINNFTTLVTPHNSQQDGTLWIYQQAYISMGAFDENKTVSCHVRTPGNGTYVFLISGSISAGGFTLGPRDAVGISDTACFDIFVERPSTILVIEVPMYY